MSRALEFHPEAHAEFLAALERYERLRPGLGAAFLDAVQTAADYAQRSPDAGAPVGTALRRVFVRRFPYCLLYAVDPDLLRIVAVAHFRRHPRYWADRQDA